MKLTPGTVARTLLIAALSGFLCLAQTPQRPDPHRPSQVGRTELVEALDRLAAQESAQRRETVQAITSRAQAIARQKLVRAKILSLLGALPERTPLHAQTLGTAQEDGFRIEKVLFDSQPGFHVTALLYVPDDGLPSTRHAAILVAPGHSPAGKAGDAFTAATFARNGFVVLSYDPIGQGERLQYPRPDKPDSSLAGQPTGEHGEMSLQPMLVGDAIAKYFLWDAVRAVDYLAGRPEVDAKRIGAFGCSGGGAMTALVAALDPRIAAAGVACYNTSFDALLPAAGPQDGEQSIPGFISSGLDFPDWIELVAPRPYAAIATYGDMFPFAGALSTVAEARRFYSLFDPASAGTPNPDQSVSSQPTGPATNPDTRNVVPPSARLQFITGPGGHGALAPILDRIVSFFIRNLQPGSDADHPTMRPAPARGQPSGIAKEALQVTPTGQVATSYPGSATVFSLNQSRAKQLLRTPHQPLTSAGLQSAIRLATGAEARPQLAIHKDEPMTQRGPVVIAPPSGVNLRGEVMAPGSPGLHPAVLMLVAGPVDADTPRARQDRAEMEKLTASGHLVLALTPSPSPAGTDEMKSPLLGPFYLLSLRADLLHRTLLGMRTDDVIRSVDYLASRPDVDASQITAIGSGHMGLVLLHAAVLDARLRHLAVDHALASYRSLIDAPILTGAPEDIVPGVLLHYDIPDLCRALGPRLTLTEPLSGTDDLSQTSTPIASLQHP